MAEPDAFAPSNPLSFQKGLSGVARREANEAMDRDQDLNRRVTNRKVGFGSIFAVMKRINVRLLAGEQRTFVGISQNADELVPENRTGR